MFVLNQSIIPSMNFENLVTEKDDKSKVLENAMKFLTSAFSFLDFSSRVISSPYAEIYNIEEAVKAVLFEMSHGCHHCRV